MDDRQGECDAGLPEGIPADADMSHGEEDSPAADAAPQMSSEMPHHPVWMSGMWCALQRHLTLPQIVTSTSFSMKPALRDDTGPTYSETLGRLDLHGQYTTQNTPSGSEPDLPPRLSRRCRSAATAPLPQPHAADNMASAELPDPGGSLEASPTVVSPQESLSQDAVPSECTTAAPTEPMADMASEAVPPPLSEGLGSNCCAASQGEAVCCDAAADAGAVISTEDTEDTGEAAAAGTPVAAEAAGVVVVAGSNPGSLAGDAVAEWLRLGEQVEVGVGVGEDAEGGREAEGVGQPAPAGERGSFMRHRPPPLASPTVQPMYFPMPTASPYMSEARSAYAYFVNRRDPQDLVSAARTRSASREKRDRAKQERKANDANPTPSAACNTVWSMPYLTGGVSEQRARVAYYQVKGVKFAVADAAPPAGEPVSPEGERGSSSGGGGGAPLSQMQGVPLAEQSRKRREAREASRERVRCKTGLLINAQILEQPSGDYVLCNGGASSRNFDTGTAYAEPQPHPPPPSPTYACTPMHICATEPERTLPRYLAVLPDPHRFEQHDQRLRQVRVETDLEEGGGEGQEGAARVAPQFRPVQDVVSVYRHLASSMLREGGYNPDPCPLQFDPQRSMSLVELGRLPCWRRLLNDSQYAGMVAEEVVNTSLRRVQLVAALQQPRLEAQAQDVPAVSPVAMPSEVLKKPKPVFAHQQHNTMRHRLPQKAREVSEDGDLLPEAEWRVCFADKQNGAPCVTIGKRKKRSTGQGDAAHEIDERLRLRVKVLRDACDKVIRSLPGGREARGSLWKRPPAMIPSPSTTCQDKLATTGAKTLFGVPGQQEQDQPQQAPAPRPRKARHHPTATSGFVSREATDFRFLDGVPVTRHPRLLACARHWRRLLSSAGSGQGQSGVGKEEFVLVMARVYDALLPSPECIAGTSFACEDWHDCAAERGSTPDTRMPFSQFCHHLAKLAVALTHDLGHTTTTPTTHHVCYCDSDPARHLSEGCGGKGPACGPQRITRILSSSGMIEQAHSLLQMVGDTVTLRLRRERPDRSSVETPPLPPPPPPPARAATSPPAALHRPWGRRAQQDPATAATRSPSSPHLRLAMFPLGHTHRGCDLTPPPPPPAARPPAHPPASGSHPRAHDSLSLPDADDPQTLIPSATEEALRNCASREVLIRYNYPFLGSAINYEEAVARDTLAVLPDPTPSDTSSQRSEADDDTSLEARFTRALAGRCLAKPLRRKAMQAIRLWESGHASDPSKPQPAALTRWALRLKQLHVPQLESELSCRSPGGSRSIFSGSDSDGAALTPKAVPALTCLKVTHPGQGGVMVCGESSTMHAKATVRREVRRGRQQPPPKAARAAAHPFLSPQGAVQGAGVEVEPLPEGADAVAEAVPGTPSGAVVQHLAPHDPEPLWEEDSVEGGGGDGGGGGGDAVVLTEVASRLIVSPAVSPVDKAIALAAVRKSAAQKEGLLRKYHDVRAADIRKRAATKKKKDKETIHMMAGTSVTASDEGDCAAILLVEGARPATPGTTPPATHGSRFPRHTANRVVEDSPGDARTAVPAAHDRSAQRTPEAGEPALVVQGPVVAAQSAARAVSGGQAEPEVVVEKAPCVAATAAAAATAARDPALAGSGVYGTERPHDHVVEVLLESYLKNAPPSSPSEAQKQQQQQQQQASAVPSLAAPTSPYSTTLLSSLKNRPYASMYASTHHLCARPGVSDEACSASVPSEVNTPCSVSSRQARRHLCSDVFIPSVRSGQRKPGRAVSCLSSPSSAASGSAGHRAGPAALAPLDVSGSNPPTPAISEQPPQAAPAPRASRRGKVRHGRMGPGTAGHIERMRRSRWEHLSPPAAAQTAPEPADEDAPEPPAAPQQQASPRPSEAAAVPRPTPILKVRTLEQGQAAQQREDVPELADPTAAPVIKRSKRLVHLSNTDRGVLEHVLRKGAVPLLQEEAGVAAAEQKLRRPWDARRNRREGIEAELQAAGLRVNAVLHPDTSDVLHVTHRERALASKRELLHRLRGAETAFAITA